MAAPLVLIADDDDLLRDLVHYKLLQRGYAVEQAADGMAAYEFIKARQPALAVLDAMMPELDGFALLRRLSNEGLLQQTSVIMLTARKLESGIVGAFRAGAADYLQKPFKPEELMSRVARIVPPESR